MAASERRVCSHSLDFPCQRATKKHMADDIKQIIKDTASETAKETAKEVRHEFDLVIEDLEKGTHIGNRLS